MKKKNLMQLTFSLGVGGLETLLLSLLNKIDRDKFNPIVCTLTTIDGLAEEFEESGIRVMALGKKNGLDFGLIFKLARILKKEKIDVLHTHNFGAWFYGSLAGKLAGVKVINTEHSNVPDNKKLQIHGEKLMARLSNTIICDSVAVADFMLQIQNIPKSKIKVILNGVDTDLYKAHKGLNSFRETLGISETTAVIACVARLHPRKNHQGLLEAALKLKQYTKDFKLLIIGQGQCKDSLEGYVKENGLSDNVLFLGNRRDIPKLLSIVDVFVLNSYSEGLPIAILEAMASSIPVIATNVGGNSEIIGVDSKAGVLIPVDSPNRLANEIFNLVSDKTKCFRMGATARERVEEKASLNAMVKHYENVYMNSLAVNETVNNSAY
jgi:sugar transferase (PEP-CTERM/EpsH1 system associated)